MSSSSVIPVVLWGNRPPSHCISCIITTYDQKTIVTGSTDGQLGIWDVRFADNGEIKIIPRNLIFAHSAKVTALTKATDGWDNQSSVISAAENGELCLWDTDDGICIQTNIIPGMHLALLSFHITVGTGKEWRVVCYGSYSDIYVIDALSLEVLHTLCSLSATNWISAACMFRTAGRPDDVVITVSLSGVLSIWMLKPTVESREIKEIKSTKAVGICCNPFTQRSLLIVCVQEWLMYDAEDFKFLASAPSPPGQTWMGGDFIAADCILVWTKDGKSYLYKLPVSCCPGVQDPKQGAFVKEPTVIQVFEKPTDQCATTDFNPVMFFSYGRRGPFYKLLLRGSSNGSVSIWKLTDDYFGKVEASITPLKGIPPVVSCSCADCWEIPMKPCGLIDCLNDLGQAIPVTASLYLPSYDYIVCGREDGSIVITSAARAAITQLLQPPGSGWPAHRLLLGHRGPVTCLLYPYDDYRRYDKEFLVSGGADFAVKLWDIFTGDLLYTFSTHAGELLRLLCTPSNCSNRVQSCICSVAQDHSVALLGLRERKCIMLASVHAFPVETIKWRALDDFLVVGCSDGSVYVWQMETGHLDRCVSGQVALNILSACDEENKPNSTGAPSKSKSPLSRKISHIASNLPTSAASAAVKKLRKSGHLSPSSQPSSPKLSGEGSTGETVSCGALKVMSTKCGDRDPEIQVLLFDTEALICNLLTEEDPLLAGNPHLGKAGSSKTASATGKRKKTPTSQQMSAPYQALPYQKNETHFVAQLLISSLHSWDLDPNMDDVCVNRLGLLKPVKPVSFGLVTRGNRFSLMLPGWYGEVCRINNEDAETTLRKLSDNEDLLIEIEDSGSDAKRHPSVERGISALRTCFQSRWQLSSALTTLHLVGLVSVANTLMSLNQISFVPKEKRLALLTTAALEAPSSSSSYDENDKPPGMSEVDVQRAMNHRAHIKAGWSQLAALHCCLLADILKVSSFKPPLLHILARKWQDRCLEVREAAQAILLAELRRIGTEGRKRVVDTWAPQLPKTLYSQGLGEDKGEKTDVMPTPPSPLLGFERSVEVQGVDDEVLFPSDDVNTVLNNVKKLLQYDMRRRQATAIVLMGVIGAEFQREIEVYSSRSGEKKITTSSRRLDKLSETPGGEVIMDYTTVRHTGKALMHLLLRPPSSALTAHTSVRRAAIDLIGRGFTLWEPYMDVSAVLISLLELSADSKNRDLTFRKGLPLSPAADTHRSARHALSLIATARPKVFIATIAKEVARSVAAASSISFNQPSPAAIAVYSHVRHQPSQNMETHSTSILNRAKLEILRIIDLMVEKTQQEVVDFLTDVVDIVVYCLDQRQLKEKGMTELFPGLCRFNMVSYSPQSRRLAVGAKNGQIALYDLRSSRCQMLPAHSSQVTALSFSPDDRALASYSFGDSKIHFWQTGSSLFGMLGSSLKCVRSYTTNSPSSKMAPALLKLIRLVWINHKNVILLMADGAEYKFSL
ncbi:WD repeat-containing protein 7-like isoform X2 [Acropora millepora]|uniref:WD repeat-containing protein 7-like isoform X2 n=1 Tax=Acropora millepora TaxID=45264 RepID=UPI001CF10DD2|nr:WD repeat-containing protein 7-like isoform X2 [Acropora millepora]